MMRKLCLPCCVWILLTGAAIVRAQNNACDPGEEPDIVVGGFLDINRYGVVNGITGYAFGTESCNYGTCEAEWVGGSSGEHPVIGQNLFRLKDGRFEQIGQSWLKHGFATLSLDLCFDDCVASDGSSLGVHCSDPYDAGLNGNQPGLGPKSNINISDGTHTHPYPQQGQSGDAIYKRLQVHNVDIDPTLNPGARYYVEGQYVSADDTAAGNGANSVSYQRVTVSGTSPTFHLALADDIVRQQAAIRAWKANDPAVTVVASIKGLEVAHKVTDLGNGFWHYEYAIQNVTNERAVGSFTVPLPHGATLANVGFHDVDYHSGEIYDGTDWAVTVETGPGPNSITWATTPHATDPDANALRWGTLYNFRFDADVPPVSDRATVAYFAPGTPETRPWLTQVPNRCGDAFCEGTENETTCAADCATTPVGSGAVPDGATVPGTPLTVSLAPGGADLLLSFSPSCVGSDTEYAIYQGTIGDFTTHEPVTCSTGGATVDVPITPASGDSYYLVVPRNAFEEGSYGLDGEGDERPASQNPCRVRMIAVCDP